MAGGTVTDKNDATTPEMTNPEMTTPARRGRASGPGTWEALRGVLSLELTQRARSTRWRVLLIGWFVVLVATVVLQTVFFGAVGPGFSGDEQAWARASAEAIATGTLLFVLLVGLLVAPAQTASSINGDRRDGVLALIQAAPVPTWTVAVGKLLAAWLASLAFLTVSLPVLLWTVIRGGMPWWAMILGVAVVALLLLGVSGMGLGMSALTPRTASSTMLSYLIVAVLVIGLPVVFLLSMPLMEQREMRQVAYMTRYDENLDLEDTGSWCREEITELRTVDTRARRGPLPRDGQLHLRAHHRGRRGHCGRDRRGQRRGCRPRRRPRRQRHLRR